MKTILMMSLLFIPAGQATASAFFQQNPTRASIGTNHYYPETKYPSLPEYELEATVRGDSISSVAVEGPNISFTSLDYAASTSGEWKWTKHVALPRKPSIGDTYEFHVTYNDSTGENVSAAVTGVVEEFPTIISPVHNSTIRTTIPTFAWSPLSIALRSVFVMVTSLADGKMAWMAALPGNTTSVLYNSDSTGEQLQSGKKYLWMLWYSEQVNDNHGIVFTEFIIGVETTTPTISGIISYAGTAIAPIYVYAFTDSTFYEDEITSARLDSPGRYELTGLADGTYYVASIMPTDDDDEVQLTDPWGVYGTRENPTSVTITGGHGLSGIDITLVDGTEGNPNPFYVKYPVELWSSNWHYGENYIVDFKVRDPDHEVISVDVRGPGITDSFGLVYDNNEHLWRRPEDRILDFLKSPPAPPLTYTFTIVDSSATIVVADIVESFLHEYATNLSPSGGEIIYGSPVFSWTWADPNHTFWVKLFDAGGNQIWGAYDLTEKTVAYSGPILTPEARYTYEVAVEDRYGNLSHAQENFLYQIAVGVKEDLVPFAFNLLQNYPNPFNPITNIRFDLPKAVPVTLEIFNILGVKVRLLVKSESITSGRHTIMWDGKDEGGISVSSGAYVYRISAGDFRASKTMALVR